MSTRGSSFEVFGIKVLQTSSFHRNRFPLINFGIEVFCFLEALEAVFLVSGALKTCLKTDGIFVWKVISNSGSGEGDQHGIWD